MKTTHRITFDQSINRKQADSQAWWPLTCESQCLQNVPNSSRNMSGSLLKLKLFLCGIFLPKLCLLNYLNMWKNEGELNLKASVKQLFSFPVWAGEIHQLADWVSFCRMLVSDLSTRGPCCPQYSVLVVGCCVGSVCALLALQVWVYSFFFYFTSVMVCLIINWPWCCFFVLRQLETLPPTLHIETRQAVMKVSGKCGEGEEYLYTFKEGTRKVLVSCFKKSKLVLKKKPHKPCTRTVKVLSSQPLSKST